MRRIVVGISGASAIYLSFRFLNILPNEIEKYLVISNGARLVLQSEDIKVDFSGVENLTIFDDTALESCISSGSFRCDCMAIIPCSSNTLAKIACGISDTLITRVAHVMIKESRKLLLAPREMPFSAIMLENMLKLSRLGVVISPPLFGSYSGRTLDDIENLILGKWCDSLGIDYDYKRWS